MTSNPLRPGEESPRDPLAAAVAVVRKFAIPGSFVSVDGHERGHIHDTFISNWRTDSGASRRYLHQRMNDKVFADIPALMHNVATVTQHLGIHVAESGGSEFQTLRLVRTQAAEAYLRDSSGAWRTYEFVEGTESFDVCDGEEHAFEAARAFGDFQARLIDLDVAELHETIPKFFDSPHRLQQFDDALAIDSAMRAGGAGDAIEFVAARRALADAIAEKLREGAFPRRIVHGDTKLNNVLFNVSSGKAVCIVDLDTCMPGYSLYDFGDLVRFTASTASEDEPDLSKVEMNLELYTALVAGYRESAQSFLLPVEVDLMPLAARLVTFTIGLRFLADHLAGDGYFKVSRPGHNLDRARVQFKLVESMERQTAEMRVRS